MTPKFEDTVIRKKQNGIYTPKERQLKWQQSKGSVVGMLEERSGCRRPQQQRCHCLRAVARHPVAASIHLNRSLR